MKRLLPFAIIVVVLVAAVAAAWYMKRAAQTTSATAGGGPAAPASSDQRVPPVAPSVVSGAEPSHFRGSASAPVTLEEFGDFECPPCGLLYPVLKGIEGQYGERIKV